MLAPNWLSGKNSVWLKFCMLVDFVLIMPSKHAEIIWSASWGSTKDVCNCFRLQLFAWCDNTWWKSPVGFNKSILLFISIIKKYNSCQSLLIKVTLELQRDGRSTDYGNYLEAQVWFNTSNSWFWVHFPCLIFLSLSFQICRIFAQCFICFSLGNHIYICNTFGMKNA